MKNGMYIRVTGPAGQFIEGGHMRWPLPVQNHDGTWKPGRWVEVSPDSNSWLWLKGVAPEHIGDALTRIDGRAWVIEYEGAIKPCHNGVMGVKARLVRPYQLPAWWEDAVYQAGSMRRMPWFQPDGAPRPDWRVFSTRADACAAVDEIAKGRLVNATLEAVPTSAHWLAGEMGRGVAYNTIWRAVETDVQNIIRALGREVSQSRRRADTAPLKQVMYDVSWDAALYCASRVCKGALPPEENRPARDMWDFLSDMWEVYQKGYALLAEVGDTFFVYERL